MSHHQDRYGGLKQTTLIYKYDEFIQKRQHQGFDLLFAPGTSAPCAGIYRCHACGRESQLLLDMYFQLRIITSIPLFRVRFSGGLWYHTPKNSGVIAPYKSEVAPLSPVAIKEGQTEVHAPSHDTWDKIACPQCSDVFLLGPNRIFGSRITK